MDHSKLPFRVCSQYGAGESQCGLLWSITDDVVLARAVDTSNEDLYNAVSPTQARANMKFIETACNNHYKLIDACKKMIEAWEARHPEAGIVAIERALEEAENDCGEIKAGDSK